MDLPPGVAAGVPGVVTSNRDGALEAPPRAATAAPADSDVADRLEISRRVIDQLESEKGRLERLLLSLPLLAAELDIDRLISGVAEAARELVGARFGVFLPTDAASAAPTYVGPPGDLFAEPPALDRAPVLTVAVGDRQSMRIDDVTLWARGDEAARAYGVLADGRLVRSWLTGSVRDRAGSVLGVLCLGHHRPHAFSSRHEELVEGLCAQLGVGIETACLFSERSRTATALQETLLPPIMPGIPGVDLAARYRATGAGNLVGGDFYDVFEVSAGTWGVILGDVSGFGPEAAALTGLARYTARAVAAETEQPGCVLERLNEAMLSLGSAERFLTAVYGLFTPRSGEVELVLARGGHPLPLVLRDDETVEQLQDRGPLIGAFPGAVFDNTQLVLRPGDSLVLVTDGVLEARDASRDEFGMDRLESLLATCAGRSAGGVAQRVERAVLDYQGGHTEDDVAIVVLRAQRAPSAA